MIEVLMALLMIVCGLAMILLGAVIASELPMLYGAECAFMGLMSLMCVICGLFCFAIITEM